MTKGWSESPKTGRRAGRSSLGRLGVAGLILAVAAGPAFAQGRWVRGGQVDGNVFVSFARYLSVEGEGQMTVRCSSLGLTVDAGAGGGGVLPEGRAIGDATEIGFALVGGAEPLSVTGTGPVRIRSDGAVLVDLNQKSGAPEVARLLVLPAERLDVTVGNQTRPVMLGPDATELFQSLAAACDAWPE
jgi:hypothetical protein